MLFESHASDLQKKLSILTGQIEEDQNKDTESKDCKNNINDGSVPQEMQIAADDHTPPSQQAETSKHARREFTCTARKDLFGNCRHDQAEERGSDLSER